MNSTVKTVLFWLLIGISALLLWEVVKNAGDGQKYQELTVTQLMGDIDQNNIRDLAVNGMELRGHHRDGSQFHTTAPSNYFTPELLENLQSKGVEITFHDGNSSSLPSALLSTWAPLILLGALWFFMIRQMQKVGNKSLGSRARFGSMRQNEDAFKDEVNFTQFMSDLDQNNIREITVAGAGHNAMVAVRGSYRDGTQFYTTGLANYFTPELLKNLRDKGVLIKFRC
jgi:cell division protease FtsH